MKLAEVTSDKHHIELTHDPIDGLTLTMNGMQQLRASNEYRYHECLALFPMLHCAPRRVFIGGGGDGLAATRLLEFDCVEEIVVCDYDSEITRLANQQPDLVELNEGSLLDERVQVVNADARAWLEQAGDQRFGLILCDFPDAYFPETNDLYTAEFYALLRDRLEPGGLVVVQTLCVSECARIIRATLASVFPSSGFYRPFPQHGFSWASDRPLKQIAPLPSWARYLSPTLVKSIHVLGHDEEQELTPRGDELNGDGSDRLVRATLAAMAGAGLTLPYPWRDEWLRLRLTEGFAEHLHESQLTLLVEGLAERADLVLGVDAPMREQHGELLRRLGFAPTGKRMSSWCHRESPRAERIWWNLHDTLDDGSLTAITERVCRAGDDAEVGELVQEAVAATAEQLFDVSDSRYPTGRTARYLIPRGPGGEALALFEVASRGDPGADPDAVEIELAWGRDASEASLALAWLVTIGWLHQHDSGPIHRHSCHPEEELLLARLGFEPTGEYEIWLR